MSYEEAIRLLGSSEAPRVTTLPDGSVDRYCHVSTGGGDRLPSRQGLAKEIENPERSTFHLTVEDEIPGGQCVNAAEQTHALGADTTCYGYLDHEVFDDLGFTVRSMGEPALVYAVNYPDSDVMFVDRTSEEGWTLDRLRDVVELERLHASDLVCWFNSVSFPALPDAFREIASLDLPETTVVLDPGDLVGRDQGELRDLVDALDHLSRGHQVIYSANRGEVRATGAALTGGAEGDVDLLREMHDTAGVDAVMHARDRAVADSGVHEVDTLDLDRVYRHTGAGDSFTGALAYAAGCGWPWPESLALANASAGYYVSTGENGGREEICSFLSEVE